MIRKLQTSARKQARQARSQQTVEAILAGGARVLKSHGYAHASTNRIAEAAGVSVGSLYQYFPSKEAIVAALIERHIEHVFETLRGRFAALASAPLPIAVRQLVEAFFDAAAVDPKLRRVFIEEVPRIGKLQQWKRVEEKVIALVLPYLASQASLARRPHLELTCFVLVHATAALTYEAQRQPGRFDKAALLDELTALIVGHLGAQR